uniref:Uncharacterized protein n=1 Tax=Quercus lobata TaxID=97700 RepID=A0A7N2LKX3_QUELO
MNVGDITIWEAGRRERLVSQNFNVWDIRPYSMALEVWNAVAGNKLYTFEGHKAPAYSMCPHNKENLHDAPCIQFYKEGILLAVSTSENGIKILENAEGVWLLRSIENQAVHTSRVDPATIAKKNISGAKIFIDVYAYVQLTCLNLGEKMPSVEDLA